MQAHIFDLLTALLLSILYPFCCQTMLACTPTFAFKLMANLAGILPCFAPNLKLVQPKIACHTFSFARCASTSSADCFERFCASFVRTGVSD